MKARGAYLIKYGKGTDSFEIRSKDIPTPKKDDVLIEVEASGLNFADVMARRGLYKPAPKPPAILGYDVCGYVKEVGENVNHVQIGDRVMALCIFGGYASHVITKGALCVTIDKDIANTTACALMTQGITAVNAAHQSIRIVEGDVVLVHAAAGGVGSLICQIARHKKARVLGTASKHKHDYLRKIGVEYPIDYKNHDFKEFVLEQFPNGIDVVFDNMGGRNFKKGLELLRNGGKIVAYGAISQNIGDKSGLLQSLRVALGFGFFSPIRYIQKSQSIIGLNLLTLGKDRPDLITKMMHTAHDLFKQNVIDPMEGGVFNYTEIGKAHDYLESGQSIGKIIIEWK